MSIGDISFWIALAIGFIGALFAIHRHDKAGQMHQHSDIADKVACKVCMMEEKVIERLPDFSKTYGVSFVELVLKAASEEDEKQVRLHELPEKIK